MLNNNPPVIVRDTDQSTVLWSVHSGDITDVIPPPLVSSGDTLYVSYASDPSSAVAAYHGFKGSYYGNSNVTLTTGGSGEGDDYSILRMSSAISIVSPGDGVSKYPSNMTYTWLIEPKTIISDYITLTFSKLHINDCNDKLTLYDGTTTAAPVLGTFCGDQPPSQWYKTSGTGALLTFDTDDVANDGYFELSYFSDGPNYHCGFSRDIGTLTANSYTFTDGSSSTQTMYAGESCMWNIEPTDATGITLIFERFDLIGGSLSIYNGNVADSDIFITMSDIDAVPAPMYFEKSIIGLKYTSNANGIMGKGFAATYYSESNHTVGPGDNSINLKASTVHSLQLPTLSNGHIMADKNLSWYITPTTTGEIYFTFTRMNLSDCIRTYVNIYNGLVPDPSKLLGKYCGQPLNGVYNDTYNEFIITSDVSALVEFISLESEDYNSTSSGSGSDTNGGNSESFELSYYSDGPNNHCGFATNPGMLTAGSMVFSDGSSSTTPMHVNQHCQWVLNPNPTGSYTNTNDQTHRIVLDFLAMDLMGGELYIYNDGYTIQNTIRDENQGEDEVYEVYNYNHPNDTNLLYSCIDCSEVPHSLISNSSSIFIEFISGSVVSGNGFHIVYYTIIDTDHNSMYSIDSNRLSNSEVVLEVPVGYVLNNFTSNTTLGFRLGVDIDSSGVGTGTSSNLIFYPRLELQSATEFDGIIDGRPSGSSILTPSDDSREVCGIVTSSSKSYFGDMDYVTEAIGATQYLHQYLHSISNVKTIYEMTGSWDISNPASSSVPLSNAHTCKYVLDSENSEAIDIVVNTYTGQNGGRLRIYTGVYGSDLLAFDSNTQRGQQNNIKIDAPCGLATIILENDSNITVAMDYGLDMSYAADRTDYSTFKFRCDEYSKLYVYMYVCVYIVRSVYMCMCIVCNVCSVYIVCNI